jgi:hypothetical protein
MARHTKYSLHSTSNESVYKHCNGAYIYNEWCWHQVSLC